jgi:hypothetical protein
MHSPKYRSFDDFTREQIRPGMRAGWSLDNINDAIPEDHDFDLDPFEAALAAAEYEEDDEDEDSDN